MEQEHQAKIDAAKAIGNGIGTGIAFAGFWVGVGLWLLGANMG